MHHKTLNAFDIYDTFLFSENNNARYGAFQSLKMMYALHMKKAVGEKSYRFVGKQLLRLILKIVALPFIRISITSAHSPCIVLQSYAALDRKTFKNTDFQVVRLQKKFSSNRHTLSILKDFYASAKILLHATELEKRRVYALLHRLLDYYHVLYTLDLSHVQTIFMENDRFPTHKALIDLAKSAGVHTVKFDYWLIDPIHHNDVYCDTYFYPNDYHKDIIRQSRASESLRFVTGGFPNFDRLHDLQKNKTDQNAVVYFTQPTIPFDEHKRYIQDIAHYAADFKIIVKVHPHESINTYLSLASDTIKVLDSKYDSYLLLQTGNIFFSVFSTISLEAKHITPDSFFINYRKSAHSYPIDYDLLGLDIIESKEQLEALFQKRIQPVSINTFTDHINRTYPNTLRRMRELCHDQ